VWLGWSGYWSDPALETRGIASLLLPPLYVHCLSGRDRTGVVIAALLRIIGVKEEDIIEEYGLSTGIEQRDYIYTALEGLSHLESYFHGIDLQVVKRSLLG